MAIKNKTRYAILGILSIHSGTGYDIKKYCDTVISNFWNENFGHIYPVLNQLLSEKFIQTEASSSPRKKVYTITSSGREEFLKWLAEPPVQQPVRSEFMLKLTFASNLPRSEVIKMITEYKQQHLSRLKEYQAVAESLEKGIKEITPERKLYLYAPLRYGILNAQAVLSWCDEILELLISLN
jgi:PadR family transcriptional regulator, regulatory protein AphA